MAIGYVSRSDEFSLAVDGVELQNRIGLKVRNFPPCGPAQSVGRINRALPSFAFDAYAVLGNRSDKRRGWNG